MGLSQPRTKTVKRLFAVSGNRCGFPNCPIPLVNENGTVIGEICHIKAHNEEGPRYDAAQADEERHGFDNLLLMCPSHHKEVDDHPAQYTVEALVEMKVAAEAGSGERESGDEVVHTLLSNSGFLGSISQSAAAGGINVVASTNSNISISSGISYQDVRRIALDIFNQNALRLAGLARGTFEKRAEEFTAAYLDAIRGDNATPPPTMADPDLQYAMFSAQQHAARHGIADLSSVLVSLLVSRTAIPDRELLQIVLDEAIETAGRLTIEQFDALSLLFVLKNRQNTGTRTVTSLARYLRADASPFLATASASRASFQHLEYTGCASRTPFGNSIVEHLLNAYAHCFVTSIQRLELEGSVGIGPESTMALQHAGCLEMADSGLVTLQPLSSLATEPIFKAAGLDDDAHVRYRNFIRQKASESKPEERLQQVYQDLPVLGSWWKHHGGAFALTSVGIAIGHANLLRRGIAGGDLRDWIK